MPLVGVVDPSHYERQHDKPGRFPNWFDLEEVLMYSQDPNLKWAPWTFEMVQAALKEHQERDYISTTTIVTACPRAEVIKRSVPYISSLDDMYAPLRGTMVHRTLEQYARPGSIVECRFFTTIDGIELSCSPDHLTEQSLTDYKVPSEATGVPTFGYPFRSQTEQLMLNAYVARHAEHWLTRDKVANGPLPFDPREHPVTSVAIVYIGPKMPKVIIYEKTEEFITPAGKTKKAKRPYVMTDREVLEEFRPRLHIMFNALRDYPAWPEPWTNPDTDEVFTAEGLWGGEPGWTCPGPPICKLPSCLARQSVYVWPKTEAR